MLARFFLPSAFLLLCTLPSAFSQEAQPEVTKPIYVILKLDDLTSKSPAWVRTIDFLQSKKVKSSVGIICQSLEKDNPHYIAWIKGIQAGGLVEFWNHGWDHKQWDEGTLKLQEFKGPSYEQQKKHLSDAQQIVKQKLGITMETFGAPFNAVDENTAKALGEDPDFKVWLYGDRKSAASAPKLMIMDRTAMNIENPLFVPNSKRVEEDYAKLSKTRDTFVIQGHPNQWDEARFGEFKKLVDFLISKGVCFTTPMEYYRFKKEAGPAPTPSDPVTATLGAANVSGPELSVSAK